MTADVSLTVLIFQRFHTIDNPNFSNSILRNNGIRTFAINYESDIMEQFSKAAPKDESKDIIFSTNVINIISSYYIKIIIIYSIRIKKLFNR